MVIWTRGTECAILGTDAAIVEAWYRKQQSESGFEGEEESKKDWL